MYPFFYITLREDRIVINDEETLFSEVKRFEQKNNIFRYSLRDRPEKMIRVQLRSEDDSRLIYDTIYRYALSSDTLLYNNSI